MSGFQIRKLDKEILPAAAYLLTAAEQKLLCRNGGLQGLAAFSGPVCVGAALFTADQGQLYLERILVTPAYQRQGAASELLRALSALGRRGGRPLVVPFAASGQRDPVYRLLAVQPDLAIVRQEGFEAKVDRQQVTETYMERGQRWEQAAELLFRQPSVRIAALCSRLAPAFPGIAAELRADSDSFRHDLCCCRVQAGEIRAACLIGEDADGLAIRLLYAAEGSGPLAMDVLAGAMRLTLENTETPFVTMVVTNPAAKKILDKLCRAYEITRRLYAAYDIGTAYLREGRKPDA